MGNDKEKLNLDGHFHFNINTEKPHVDLFEYIQCNNIKKGALIINTKAEFECFKLIDSSLLKKIYPIFGLNLNDLFIYEAIELCEKNSIKFGIKLHPRLFDITSENEELYIARIDEIDSSIIIVDDFYYGNKIQPDFYVNLINDLANRYPLRKIVMAHAGGVNMLEHVMATKTNRNVFYDISLSINYLCKSSIQLDLIWLIQYMSSRVFLGSDYPDFTIQQAKDMCKQLAREGKIDMEKLDNILYKTFDEVFI